MDERKVLRSFDEEKRLRVSGACKTFPIKWLEALRQALPIVIHMNYRMTDTWAMQRSNDERSIFIYWFIRFVSVDPRFVFCNQSHVTILITEEVNVWLQKADNTASDVITFEAHDLGISQAGVGLYGGLSGITRLHGVRGWR